jgi:hypothetical protein
MIMGAPRTLRNEAIEIVSASPSGKSDYLMRNRSGIPILGWLLLRGPSHAAHR